MELREKYDKLITDDKVVLFMKGNKQQPQCGFSARVVDMLSRLEVDFATFDILGDEEMRAAVKEFSNWPTYPQLYVNGKLVGGCDIITEMFNSGELEKVLKK